MRPRVFHGYTCVRGYRCSIRKITVEVRRQRCHTKGEIRWIIGVNCKPVTFYQELWSVLHCILLISGQKSHHVTEIACRFCERNGTRWVLCYIWFCFYTKWLLYNSFKWRTVCQQLYHIVLSKWFELDLTLLTVFPKAPYEGFSPQNYTPHPYF